jgi:hypothetical protein
MRSAREAESLRLMRTMLSYLVQHSDAMDTADGIRQWWLPLNWECSREQIQEALDDLVAKQWLIVRGSVEEFKLYGLNKESLTEVMQFIFEQSAQSTDKVQ